MIVNIDRCPGCGIMLDELRLLRAACAEKDRRITTQAEAIAELTRRRDELESLGPLTPLPIPPVHR